MIQDILCDIFTRIRNAVCIKKSTIRIPKTRITVNLRQIFYSEGFINEISEPLLSTNSNKQMLLLRLKYKGIQRIPVIIKLQRVSRPGLRIYVDYKEIPRVLGNLNLTILSTSKGLITNHQALYNKIGGEVLCSIW